MRQSFDTYMEASGATLVVFSGDVADLSFSRVTTGDIERIEALPGVDSVSRANFTAILAPKLGTGLRHAGFVPVFGRMPHERLMIKYERFLLDGGRLPEELSEILVGEYTATPYGIKLGDRFPLFNREVFGIKDYEVVGIYRSDINWENLGIVAHASIIQKYLNATDTYSALFVYTSPENADSVREQIGTTHSHLIAMPSGEFTKRFDEQLQYIDEFLAIMTVIALVVGALGVLNTMMMNISERTREIGTLRALGWSRRRVVGLVVSEGLLIAFLGGALGLAAGTVGTELLLWWFPSGLLEATYSLGTYMTGALVAVIVGAIGASYPALRAASLRPVEALRYE